MIVNSHIGIQGVEGDVEMNINIRNGNVTDELKAIPDESVDCVISSPPYYSLRDYSGVATYTDGNYHNVVRIASMDLQKHRDNALEIHREKYYLTEPVFNKKDQKWYVSLKYVEIIKKRLEIEDSGTNINANIEVASIRKLEEFELEVKN